MDAVVIWRVGGQSVSVSCTGSSEQQQVGYCGHGIATVPRSTRQPQSAQVISTG
jgi:hypothetical protein